MDIDTTPPAAHPQSKSTMQLDIPPPPTDDVMMEVDLVEFPPITPSSPRPLQASEIRNNSNIQTSQNNLSASLLQSSKSHSMSQALSSPTSASASRCSDSTSSVSRPFLLPPVVLIASSDVPAWPKFKLDQLFIEWLALPQSKPWLYQLLQDPKLDTSIPPVQHQHHPTLNSTSSSPRLPKLLGDHISPSTGSPSRAVNSPTINTAAIAIPASPPTPQHNQHHSFHQQQAPSSPVSRLFRTHVPFGDSEVFSPRSPAPAVPASSSGGGLGIRHMFLSASPGTELDLDKCGTTSSSTVLLQEQQRALEAAATSDKSSVQQSLVLSPSSSDSASADNGLIMRDVSPAKSREDGVGAGSGVEKAVDDSSAVDAAPDCKALDRVADGIAGMSAAAVDLPAVKAVSVSEKEQSDPVLLEGDMTPETDVMRDSDTGNILVRDDEGVGQGKKMGLASSASVSVGGEGEGVRKSVDGGIAARADKALSDTGPDLKMEKNAQLLVSSAIPPVTPKVCRSEDATMMESSRLSGMKKKMLPRFYFPCGRDAEAREKKECEVLKEYFKLQRSKKKMHGVCRADIAELVVEVIGLPSYFAGIVFNAILKMFPSASSVEGKVNEQLRDHQLGQGGSGDVMKIEAATPNVKQNRSSLSTMENESGGTASDATMGDVNGVGNEERRVNGFHSSSQHQEASSNVEVHNASDMSGGSALYNSGNSKQVISEEQFVAYYNSLCAGRSKEERLFYALLEPGAKRNYLVANDFKPLLQALLMCHQGLTFLHVTPEFQQRYSETVIERIYFGCTRQHNGRLTIQDIKNSKLLDTLMVVDEEEDINRERKYFSYEHFYVLYCRFWELDGNHDLQIDKEDLLRYGSHSLTARIVERVFRGYARPLDTPENSGFMSYTDFIWFCLSEEDKTSDTAIDYWFRCVDLDGDGLITMYDMEFFYKEQLHRMDTFGHEPVQIRDILCQLLDMINPNVDPPVIRRGDLKRCKLAGNFFNVLFNLNKFFAIEARDPLQIRQEHATPELTDWDRFAALEYLRLSAEEEGEEDESWEDVGEAGNPLMAGEAPF